MSIQALVNARAHDPFAFLGQHREGGEWVQRVFLPYAEAVWVGDHRQPMKRVHDAGIFETRTKDPLPKPYKLGWRAWNHDFDSYDPYSFPPFLGDLDLHLFNEGKLLQAGSIMGAQMASFEGVDGVSFAVWAPNAERVSVVGDFNSWDGRVHQMRARGSSGVWEIFIPSVQEGSHYKFEIRNRNTGAIMVKADPYAKLFELRPGTAARVTRSHFQWNDSGWLQQRAEWDWQHAPFSCYELHMGSWRLKEDGRFLSYRELADAVIPYVKDMGFTHIELLPVSEHPLDESWGYQTTGYFAPTSRFGTPDDFRYFVDRCHQEGLGVLLDWVPAHFPRDDWALARFDGTALYEHQDPRIGEHQDWGTYVPNYGRNEVRTFLLANAYYWFSEFHLDGLRVDAVASLLYLDYSRKDGEWIPNKYGGNENLEAIEFIREMNMMVHKEFPGALTIAEESTSWPMVSRPVYLGGLGFSMKWNMGWMNDTLAYFEKDPVYRHYHHDYLTFGQLYAYTENFVLPFSHDEVVHGKRSLLDKMPGDGWQKFANLRLLFTYQFSSPGKVLNFMGNEIAQGREWAVKTQVDWHLLEHPWHAGVKQLFKDLNHLYRRFPAMHQQDFTYEGFSWVDCHDAGQSTLSYLRYDKDGNFLVVVLNFTPVVRDDYRIGVPEVGTYTEIFNSDSEFYGGSNVGNGRPITAEEKPWMGRPYSIPLTLPPLAGIILVKSQ